MITHVAQKINSSAALPFTERVGLETCRGEVHHHRRCLAQERGTENARAYPMYCKTITANSTQGRAFHDWLGKGEVRGLSIRHMKIRGIELYRPECKEPHK